MVTFRPAMRENVTLLIGLVGASGGGKTYTAMRLAKGISGDKPFAVIDTEARRALHYADQFKFEHCDLKAPFSPSAYADAIAAADDAKYPVILVDSASHEHAGIGGILEMQEAEYQRLGGRDSVKMLSWVKPKGEHRKMVQRLLQVRAHLILCFRAEEKVEMVRGQDGKTEVRKKVTDTGIQGWVPICEKNLPYELTCSLLLLPAHPGVPLPIKLQEQHRHLFPLDKPITEESGKRLAEWARGGESPKTQHTESGHRPGETMAPPVDSPEDDRARLIAIVETAAPGRIQVFCKRLFNDPNLEWRNLDIAALQNLATNVNMSGEGQLGARRGQLRRDRLGQVDGQGLGARGVPQGRSRCP